MWLYLPRYQGAKIVIDGVFLAKFDIANAPNGKGAKVTLMEYLDKFLLAGLVSAESVVGTGGRFFLLANTSLYTAARLKLVELSRRVREDYQGSVISYVLFVFVDNDEDLEKLKSNFGRSVRSVSNFVSKMGGSRVLSETNAASDLMKTSQRSVSMPSLVDANEGAEKAKRYLSNMASDSTLFRSTGANKDHLRVRKSYGNLRKGI